MSTSNLLGPSQKRRRAASLILVLVTLPVMFGMAALAIDVGAMYNTRADLQRAADAAALAGTSVYITDTMMQIHQGGDSSTLLAEVEYMVNERATGTSALNPSFGTEATILGLSDIQVGWIDVTSATSPIQTGVLPSNHNAVRVTARRSGESGNGPLGLFFAPIFGIFEAEITASAVAVFDDRVGGLDVGDSGGALLPFTVHQLVYETDSVSGDDNFGYDDGTGSVMSGADGIREINLYPHDVGPGNDGLLNLPSSTPNGVPELRDQIDYGVQPEDIEEDIGGTEFKFVDDDGDPMIYTLDGNPGFKTTLESNIEGRVGDVVGFLLHDQATGTGSNLTYRIIGIRFGRLMDVKLSGNPNARGVWIQPAIYSGPGLRLDKDVPSSGGTMGRLVLAR